MEVQDAFYAIGYKYRSSFIRMKLECIGDLILRFGVILSIYTWRAAVEGPPQTMSETKRVGKDSTAAIYYMKSAVFYLFTCEFF